MNRSWPYAATVGESDRGSTVAILAAHPESAAILWSAKTGPAGAREVPLVHLNTEHGVTDLTAVLREMFGHTVTLLRFNEMQWDQDWNPTALVAEIAPPSNGIPGGYEWALADQSDLMTAQPAWVRASLAAWVKERNQGWSPLRPAWSRPGWFDRAADWMLQRMADAGYRDPQPPRVRQLWGLSVVLSADSRDGTAFLKCSTGLFRKEAVLTRALDDRTPGLVPSVVAVEPASGWLLMRDFGDRLLGDEPEPRWTVGLELLARIQRAWADQTRRLSALGAPTRPLAELADWILGSAHDQTLMGRLPPDVRQDWRAAAPTLAGSCHRLDRLGPDSTLVNSDFHPWNVAVTDTGAVLFDWNDPAISHPFLDLATYVLRAKDPTARRRLLDHYLGSWTEQLAGAELRQAADLALIDGCVYQARMYGLLLPTLMPDDLGALANGDQYWMKRALRTLEQGIDVAY